MLPISSHNRRGQSHNWGESERLSAARRSPDAASPRNPAGNTSLARAAWPMSSSTAPIGAAHTKPPGMRPRPTLPGKLAWAKAWMFPWAGSCELRSSTWQQDRTFHSWGPCSAGMMPFGCRQVEAAAQGDTPASGPTGFQALSDCLVCQACIRRQAGTALSRLAAALACLVLGIDQGAPSPGYESKWNLDECTDSGCTMSSTVCPASLLRWGTRTAGPCS